MQQHSWDPYSHVVATVCFHDQCPGISEQKCSTSSGDDQQAYDQAFEKTHVAPTTSSIYCDQTLNVCE